VGGRNLTVGVWRVALGVGRSTITTEAPSPPEGLASVPLPLQCLSGGGGALEASADGEQQHDGQQQPGQHEEEEEEQGPKEAGGIVGGALGAAAQERLCEPGVSILESVHID
jgi:hypothetical protein